MHRKHICRHTPRGVDNNEMLIIRESENVIDNIKGDIKIFVVIENQIEFKRDGRISPTRKRYH